MIIARNNDCQLSKHLIKKYKLYIDKAYSKDSLIDYCKDLFKNYVPIIEKKEKLILRKYQTECIDLINSSKKNVIISLPTGCGKNVVITHSLKLTDKNKYLILVPRIILMEQIYKEFINMDPKLKKKIQLLGDGNINFVLNKAITICVYNSIDLINEFKQFTKIFIDESHHLVSPGIYCNDENESDNDSDDESDNNSDDESDDGSDEDIKKSYLDKIRELSKLNNNVYLSATIDKIDEYDYYNKDIRYMIEQKYLCDYNIYIPIFTNDVTNKNVCEHLIGKYRNIIIYCNSQKEGKKINELMNKLQPKCSEYIDCDTTKTKRNSIINKYKKGDIPFLINVRILVEGFNAPTPFRTRFARHDKSCYIFVKNQIILFDFCIFSILFNGCKFV